MVPLAAPNQQTKKQLGSLGENQAKLLLQSKGWQCIACNYSTRFGEIDLICIDSTSIIFVEVKTRSTNRLGYPEEAVTRSKRSHLQKAAEIFLVKHPQYQRLSPRIDVIAIELERLQVKNIRHYENVV